MCEKFGWLGKSISRFRDVLIPEFRGIVVALYREAHFFMRLLDRHTRDATRQFP